MPDHQPKDFARTVEIPERADRSRVEERRLRRLRKRRVRWATATAALLLGVAAAYTARCIQPTAADGAQLDARAPAAPPGALKLASALTPVMRSLGDARLSVALLDTKSDKWAAYGGDAFDTASIVKVDILSTLLLQAQDAGRTLTVQERRLTTDMIENSDNESTSTLWAQIGNATGLDKANKRLGLTQTKGGEGTVWGITQTTASDQIRLLEAVFGDRSSLSADSRAYIQHLMYHIAPDQDWGVSAAADASRPTALKNGWLQRSQTLKWDVNSIGRIEKNGRVFYLAVLLNGCSTEEIGIDLVEHAARAAVTAFSKVLTGTPTS
ncbi:serine hydrolase [Streptomyces sp. NPDC087843]|uniref:serine hydrolase n=1 Tax=Streptomyces sp. NPDC087843 TaxID=3365804 RepID=UPI003810F9B8